MRWQTLPSSSALITLLKVGFGPEEVIEAGLGYRCWVVWLEVVHPNVSIFDEVIDAWSFQDVRVLSSNGLAYVGEGR